MIDIGDKEAVPRCALARGQIELRESTLERIEEEGIKKGDPLQAAEVAGIEAVKKTPETIPHCHPIPIDDIKFWFEMDDDGIKVECQVKAVYKTGVEMEALVGVNTALLTIWDMVKYLEKDQEGQYPDTRITDIRVVKKKKGD